MTENNETKPEAVDVSESLYKKAYGYMKDSQDVPQELKEALTASLLTAKGIEKACKKFSAYGRRVACYSAIGRAVRLLNKIGSKHDLVIPKKPEKASKSMKETLKSDYSRKIEGVAIILTAFVKSQIKHRLNSI